MQSSKEKWSSFKHRRAIVINDYIEMKKQQISCKVLLQYIFQWRLTVKIRAAIENWKLQFKKRFKAKIICAIIGPIFVKMLDQRGGHIDIILHRKVHGSLSVMTLATREQQEFKARWIIYRSLVSAQNYMSVASKLEKKIMFVIKI